MEGETRTKNLLSTQIMAFLIIELEASRRFY